MKLYDGLGLASVEIPCNPGWLPPLDTFAVQLVYRAVEAHQRRAKATKPIQLRLAQWKRNRRAAAG
jgi:hypothetical protein